MYMFGHFLNKARNKIKLLVFYFLYKMKQVKSRHLPITCEAKHRYNLN